MLERCTLRVLMVAITKGAVHEARSSSSSGLLPRGCFGPSKPGVSTNGFCSMATRLRSFAAAANVALMLAAVPPGERALHIADAALDAADRRAENLLRRLLDKEHAEFERQRIEAAGKHDARAARFRRRLMRVDHLPHPDRFAAEIEIVGARRRADRDQLRAVELIRPDRRDHRSGLIDHRFQRRGIAGVGHDQGRVGRRADRVAHRSEFFHAAPGHRPFQIAVAVVMRRQIFGDELAGETGGAIDDDVEFRRKTS